VVKPSEKITKLINLIDAVHEIVFSCQINTTVQEIYNSTTKWEFLARIMERKGFEDKKYLKKVADGLDIDPEILILLRAECAAKNGFIVEALEMVESFIECNWNDELKCGLLASVLGLIGNGAFNIENSVYYNALAIKVAPTPAMENLIPNLLNSSTKWSIESSKKLLKMEKIDEFKINGLFEKIWDKLPGIHSFCFGPFYSEEPKNYGEQYPDIFMLFKLLEIQYEMSKDRPTLLKMARLAFHFDVLTGIDYLIGADMVRIPNPEIR
jgi:hypothetical protein